MSFLLVAEYALLGALLAQVDRYVDREEDREGMAVFLSVLASLLMAYLILTDFSSTIIFTAVLLGVLAGRKVDSLPFLIGLLISGGAVLYSFLYSMLPSVLLLPLSLAVAGALDEYGHDREKKISSGLMRWFFRHRFTLKLGVFIVAYIGLFSAWHLLAFLAFDLAYELVSGRK